MRLHLIESQASVTLCNTSDHAFERFMPVPVTRNTERQECPHLHVCTRHDSSWFKNFGCRDFTSVLLKTTYLELAITLMFICTHKLGMNVTQESKTHLLSKLLTTRGNARQNKKHLGHCLIASDTRIGVAAVYLVRRDFFFGYSA